MVPLLKTNKEKNLKNNLIVLTDKCAIVLFLFFLKRRKNRNANTTNGKMSSALV